jgi:hypothetical protein
MNAPLANAEVANSGLPFSINEPEIYRAEAYLTTNGTSERYFIARNRAIRRFDTYAGDTFSMTELVRDNNRYVIDHARKVYYVEPSGDKGPKAIDPASIAIFQNTRHHEFEETGRDGDTVRYHAKKLPGDPDEDTVVTVDQKTGLMMREVVTAPDAAQAFTFELRNVRLEASDDLFQIPDGYRQVNKAEFGLRSNVNAKTR